MLLALLIALASLVLPFVAGFYLAKSFRMPDYGWKIGLVLFAVTVGAVVVGFGWPPRLGIDLRGGVQLVYEYELSKERLDQGAPGTNVTDKLIGALRERVDPSGVEEITIRPYGEQQIEIIVPDADENTIEDLKLRLSRIGTLEFRILANRYDHADLMAKAQALKPEQMSVTDANGAVKARWVPMDDKAVAEGYATNPEHASRKKQVQDKELYEILLVADRYNVTGEYLIHAAPDVDEKGRDAVSFKFNQRGGDRFRRLTSDNLPVPSGGSQDRERQLGIVLDGRLHSAANILGPISTDGQITGTFTREEVEIQVAVLNAGSLPTALKPEPSSQMYIGPTLGQDTIRRGTLSMTLSVIVVIVFTTIYYRFAGLVAAMAMLTNLLILLAAMICIKAAFTLPGLAGLALTVGMAIDANVLIYERMREELERGSTLRMAIRQGFTRAMSTIIDSNLTTLITAVVLYAVGTDAIRGFAVTLFLGIVLSMFTAIFCARVVFDVVEKMRWVTNLKMMKFLGKTSVDFLGQRYIAGIASAAFILIGLVAAGSLGKTLLDIDFNGGVQVELLFKQPRQIAEVRSSVEKVLPDVTVSSAQSHRGEEQGLRFQVSTAELDIDKVQEAMSETFEGELATRTLAFKQISIDETPKSTDGNAETATGDAVTDGADAAEQTNSETTDSEPAGTIDPQDPAACGQPPDDPAATESTPESTNAATDAAAESTETTNDDTTTGAADAAELVTTSQTSFGVQSRYELDYTPARISHDVLIAEIKQALADVGLSGTQFTISNPQYQEGSTAGYPAWTLDLALPPERAEEALEVLEAKIESMPIFPSAFKIGGRVANDMKLQALYALFISMIFIVAYIWVRFQKVVFGLAAVAALLHDVLVTVGALALSHYLAGFLGFLLIDPFKINLTVVAAILTIIGYSLNDTIVVFDRIREVRGKSPFITHEMLNLSINQTLGRTLLTGLTTMMVVLILYIMGGQAIHAFAYTLFVGMIVGTYSSVYVASPILLWLGKKRSEVQPTPTTAGRVAAMP